MVGGEEKKRRRSAHNRIARVVPRREVWRGRLRNIALELIIAVKPTRKKIKKKIQKGGASGWRGGVVGRRVSGGGERTQYYSLRARHRRAGRRGFPPS